MIKLKDVTKEYGKGNNKVVALDNVSMEITTGHFVLILGASGSGKSTLMNLMGAIDKVTSGSIFIDDEDITKLSRDRLAEFRNQKIGFVFQAFHLEPAYSVIDNVCLPLLIANVKKSVRVDRAKDVLESLGMLDKAHEKTGNLSGGQKQRVAIARALVHNPDIILADEPTGNLDSKNGQEVMEILRGIADSGRTVIMVTHNTEQVKYADTVITMKDGRIDSIVNYKL